MGFLYTYQLALGGEKVSEKAIAAKQEVVKAKPAAAKGKYIKSITVASTMGPGVKLQAGKASDLVEAK